MIRPHERTLAVGRLAGVVDSRARIVAATTAEFERRHGFPLTPMRGGLSVAATRPRLCADCLKLDLDARTLTFIEP
jgi:hypothetical protein